MKRGIGELTIWVLLVCAFLLDIAAALWGTLLTVVIFSFAALLAAGTLKIRARS
jgi:hypothetical protein